ncbi:hypothetical protein G7Y31_01105 [Corynebacterium lizhenjunii]|uniref:Uncharacterized protein n=1 Tax=Corynebacterium lizhenjunii TaxID=2709394 RepID=A0A7T0KGI9_9CORY|nr:hypothetical protein [Corynebacterium lizhenjunii]QPK79353.1 hypothetical protein G7Y31_01105 [Corynebacterium lizhenjunii]
MLNFKLLDFFLNLLVPLILAAPLVIPAIVASVRKRGVVAAKYMAKISAVSFVCGLLPPALWLSWNPTTPLSVVLTQPAPGDYPTWQLVCCALTLVLFCVLMAVCQVRTFTGLVVSAPLVGIGAAAALTLGSGFPETTSQDGVGQLICFVGVGVSAFFIILAVLIARSYVEKWSGPPAWGDV